MAFSVVAYAAGMTMWIYQSKEDSLADCVEPDFFLRASEGLREGDLIILSARDGCRVVYVTEADPNTVTVAGVK